MNTKTLDKVRSDLKLIINQNQQIQSEIKILQIIATNKEFRLLLEKMEYFVKNCHSNL